MQWALCVCVWFCVWVGGCECVNRAVCVFVCVCTRTQGCECGTALFLISLSGWVGDEQEVS